MPPDKPRRFVVQHHVLSANQHWDLMLEYNDTLATWQLSDPPENCAKTRVTAIRLADHRTAYLDYEGPVSNDRGHVAIADAGTYRLISRSEALWEIELTGRALRGVFRLSLSEPGTDRWEFGPAR